MGKGKKRQKVKYEHVDLENFSFLETPNKRSEEPTPNNENNKKDVTQILVGDVRESKEPLKEEGTKLDVLNNKINECSANKKVKSKKESSLDFQDKNSSDVKKEQTKKMEYDVSDYTSNDKAWEKSNKDCSLKKKKTKNIILNQNNITNSELSDYGEKCENKNVKVFEKSNKSFNSSKQKMTKTRSCDEQNTKNSSDEEINGETECIKKNSEVCEVQKSQYGSDEKFKFKESNINNKINKRDGKDCNYSSDSNKNNIINSNKNKDQIIDKCSDEIVFECNELETISPFNKYKTRHSFKNDYKNNLSGSFHYNPYENKIKNNNYKDKSQTSVASFLEEIDEDLFNLSNDIALAHCVAEDLRMGAGIAVEFKKKFGGVGKLFDQKLSIGNVGIVERHGQKVFYLITKKYSKGKPTMQTLEMALKSLLSKMKELKLTKLGIPTIGCGLDGLDWSDVKSLIINIFDGSGIHISVCIPSKLSDRKAQPPLNIFMTPKNLWEMEAQTDIIILIDLEKINKNDWTDDILNQVDVRYPFKEKLLKDVKNGKLNSGRMFKYDVRNERIFCVIFEQKHFYSCLEDVFGGEYFKSRGHTNYLAIQSESLNFDEISRIELIFRSIPRNNELWLCGHTEIKHQKIPYAEYLRNLPKSNLYDNSFNYNNPSFFTKERSYYKK